MEHSNLYDLIKHLQYGTKLHIGVVFLGNYGNEKCILPHIHQIHKNPICDKFKSTAEGMKRCHRCRNYAIKKATQKKTPFGALCTNGVYEYTYPVCVGQDVVCIIFIGNILTDSGLKKIKQRTKEINIPKETMERNISYEKCEELGRLIESYILFLLEKYPPEKQATNPLCSNIVSYIADNIEYDISMRDVADFFHYNVVYFGRLFKKEFGTSFSEYLRTERIKLAKTLLKTEVSIISISQKTGFNTVTYFNRIFKQYVGKTPSEYRKSIKE